MLRKIELQPLALLAALTLAAGASGCGTSSSDPIVPVVEAPVISAFIASPAAIETGGSATLSWTVTGATALALSPGPGAVSGSSLAVSPAATTTYTLTATNAAGSTSASATVTVTAAPPPVSVAVTPTSAALLAGGTATFTATVENALDASVTWSVEEPGGGTITSAGLYTAPAIAGTFHVVATATADPSKHATAAVTVTVPPPPVSVAVTPTTATLLAGATATFTATVENALDASVTWSVEEAGGGTITSAGLYTAPAIAGTFHVVATAVTDPSKHATAAVTVTVPPPPVSVAVTPTTATLLAGGTATFTATVSNAVDTSVAWTVQEVGGGTITSAGLYTAPAVAGTFHVVATAIADPSKHATAAVTVTVPPPPVSVAVTPTSAALLAGGTATFTATVSNALDTSVSWTVQEVGGGTITSAGLYTAPAVAGTFHVVATAVADPSKHATATVAVSVPVGPADVTVVVDTARSRTTISPFIYGASATNPPPGATLLRAGGNRYTAWNWELNYSNSGSIPWYWLVNDTNMGSPSDGPAATVLRHLATAKAAGAGLCATIPIQGWVAKDGAGTVSATAPVSDRFLPNEPRRGSAFPASPDTGDGAVYQDELAAHLDARWSGATQPLHLELDNEPGIWHETHPEIQRAHVTYEELLARTIASASALKDAAPTALVLGPVGYGWNEFTSLQNAPDAPAHGDFLDYYLDGTRVAGAAQGRRLLDALDIHYYSEAQGGGVRVAEAGAGNTSDAVVLARVHAPRSLVDGYVESSWIANSIGGPIRLIPRMLAKIAAHHPGTRLAITEYDFGGEAHISGTVALADALGLFGREGVYAAAYWPVLPDTSWANAAWLVYRNYDGLGSAFGDTSVQAASGDVEHLSAFASVDAAGGDRVVLVLVHRPTSSDGGPYSRARTVRLEVGHSAALGRARVWQVTRDATIANGAARPQRLTDLTVVGNALTVTVPAMSVTVVELTR